MNWLSEQQDPKYHPPTEMCGNSSPMWITIMEPKDKSRVDGSEVKIRVRVDDPNKVTKVEFTVDGTPRHVANSEPWELTVDLSKGKHRVDVKAYDEKGFDGSRFVEFAVGEDW